MPDPFLVGNGRWCSTCYPAGRPRTFISRGAAERFTKAHPQATPRPGCNECAGAGRITFTAEEIVAATVAEARTYRGRVA